MFFNYYFLFLRIGPG